MIQLAHAKNSVPKVIMIQGHVHGFQ